MRCDDRAQTMASSLTCGVAEDARGRSELGREMLAKAYSVSDTLTTCVGTQITQPRARGKASLRRLAVAGGCRILSTIFLRQ
jgi:hypothetical protein